MYLEMAEKQDGDTQEPPEALPMNIPQIIREYCAGKTQAEIATEQKVSTSTICRVFRDHATEQDLYVLSCNKFHKKQNRAKLLFTSAA